MKVRWVINDEDKRALQIKYEGHLWWENVPVIHENELEGGDHRPEFHNNEHFISIEMNR